jgi:predicted AlkP superfamily phosphohydrolase/phosphomutase
MQWGPVRSVARKVYDALGLHGKISLPQPVNWAKTRAYTSIRSTGEGININVAGRESDGMVDPSDLERVRDDVVVQLAAFVDPRTGAHPVARVLRREEVFKGRFAQEAPDLLLEPAPLYSLTHARRAVEPADWISGDHRIEGVLAAAGGPVARAAFPESARLVDLAPTILAAAGAPASVHHTGSALGAISGDRAAARVETASGPAPQEDPATASLDEQEASEVEEHLRGLGYLE